MWLRPCWSRCEDQRRASVISVTPAARDRRRLDNDTAWRQSVLPYVVQVVLQIGVQTLMQTCLCKSICTLLWTPFCARVCRRICAPFYLPFCMPPMRLCVYAVYRLAHVLLSKLAVQLVYKAVYVDEIVEHFVHQSPEEYVDHVSGHFKGQLLRRCKSTDAANKSMRRNR